MEGLSRRSLNYRCNEEKEKFADIAKMDKANMISNNRIYPVTFKIQQWITK